MKRIKTNPLSKRKRTNWLQRATQATLFTLVGTTGLMGCGELNEPGEHRGPALTALGASIEGALDTPVTGDVRGALVWSVFDDEMVDCLAGVPDFEAPLDYYAIENEAVLAGLQTCSILHSGSDSETESVEVESTFPSAFELPIYDLPSTDVLTGSEGARMGIATMELYVDGNENERLDLAPEGSLSWHDGVIGTSGRLRNRTTADYVIYREGEVSPLWKLISGIYGCPEEPPVGYSTMHIEYIGDDQEIFDSSCSIDTESVNVIVESSSAMENRICEDSPGLEGFHRIGPNDSLSPDDAYYCQDDFTLVYANDAEALCPTLQRYDLVGCTDRSTQESCARTYFEDFDNTPAWWPCGFNSINGGGAAGPATSGNDEVAHFRMRSGVMSLSGLTVVADTPNGEIARSFALEFVDNDDNGIFNEGDVLNARETEDVFNENTPIGGYEVRLMLGDEIKARGFYFPRAVDNEGFPEIEIEVTDATIEESAATGVHFFIDAIGGQGAYSLDELLVDVAYSCEAPAGVRAPNLGLDDRNNDGLFNAGDRLSVRIAEEDNFGFPSGYDCITLRVEPGPNVSIAVGSGLWTPFGSVSAELLPGPYSAERLDTIAVITIGSVGEIVPLTYEDGSSVVRGAAGAVRNNMSIGGIDTTLEVIDLDDNGLISEGDQVILTEAEEFFNEEQASFELRLGLYIDGAWLPVDELYSIN